MDCKKILFKDFSKFLDTLVETQPCTVDLVGSINKSANETQFIINIRIRYKAKMSGQKAREGFLAVNTCDRKMVSLLIKTSRDGIL